MIYNKIDLIPAIIKGSRPSQYEGESFTALEYVAKISAKTNECIKEYNNFVDEICKEFTNFKDGELITRDLFERKVEQMIVDFKKVIDLKYKSQDLVISRAVEFMQTNLTKSVAEVLTTMVDNGTLNDDILQAIGNLKSEFQTTVDFVTREITAMHEQINTFIESTNTTVDTLHNEWTEEKAEMEQVTTQAIEATQNANDAISTLNLTVMELDGATPDVTTNGEDIDGGLPI